MTDLACKITIHKILLFKNNIVIVLNVTITALVINRHISMCLLKYLTKDRKFEKSKHHHPLYISGNFRLFSLTYGQETKAQEIKFNRKKYY